MTPALTSVRVAISQQGTRAVEMLLDTIEHGDETATPEQQVLPTSLVIRASSGGHP